MKRLLSLSLLFFAHSLVALPLTNIADPVLYECHCFQEILEGGFTLRSGYWGDFVFNRDAQLKAPSSSTYESAQQLSRYTNAGMFVLNFCDFVEGFFTFGQSQYELVMNNPLQWSSIRSGFSWSAGGRIAYRYGSWIVGAEGQYFQSNLSSQTLTNLATGVINQSKSSSQGPFREWQGGVGIAYHIESYSNLDLIPYLGVKFSGFDENFNLQGLKYKARADKPVGYAVGATALLGHALGLTAEGRFGDESALFVSGQFRF